MSRLVSDRPLGMKRGKPTTRFRAVWAAVLSFFFPGLGQIQAGAWRLGVGLLVANEALSISARAIIARSAPTRSTLEAVSGLVVVSLVLMVGGAVDAARRSSRERAAPVVRGRRWWFRPTWFAAIALIVIGVGADALLPLGWRTFFIPSASMVPTLMVGDDIAVDIREPARQPLRRGDVIVFTMSKLPAGKADPGAGQQGDDGPEIFYVKRVIGLPGDRVAFQNGHVVLNGATLALKADGDIIIPEEMSFGTKAHRWIETLPDGRAYTVATTADGPAAAAMAEVTVPAGQVFVMGDNRDNSLDSRDAEFGTVAADHVVGTARTIYWSGEQGRLLTPIR
jgi:signal peptidase I